jgi:hypothetical protein
MFKVVAGTISLLLDPAFIEVKAVLAGHLLAHANAGGSLISIAGLLARIIRGALADVA